METGQNSVAPPQAQDPPSHPPQPPAPSPAPAPALPPQPTMAPAKDTKKRSFDSIDELQNSPYYKMRAIVRDLRPHFLEVLRTPDFQNCKSAEEIREKMKIVMDLYKELTAETIYPQKCQNPSASISFSGETKEEHQQDMKPSEKPPTDRAFTGNGENKPPASGSIQNQQSEDGQADGTFMVGGSAFGWNFIMYSGSKAVYYGRTKESFQSAKVRSPSP